MKDADKILVDEFSGGYEDMTPEDIEHFEDDRVGNNDADADLDKILKEYGVGK
jgi:hypothetical protein